LDPAAIDRQRIACVGLNISLLNNEAILLWKPCGTRYYQDANQSKNFETTDGSGPLTSLLSDQAPPPD
jgi:hypothetical protein